jgi:3-phenylpropionate/cinnamic acid dioxygenase small subunit
MTVDDQIAVLEVRDVEHFAYREARLLDEWRLDEWLDLWAPDGYYWVPCNALDTNPSQSVSIIYDDYSRIEERVYRLTHADAHSQDPRSRTTHYLTSMEFTPLEDGGRLHAAALIIEVRGNHQEIYGGRVDYRVRLGSKGLQLVEKTFRMSRNDTALGNLTFLL